MKEKQQSKYLGIALLLIFGTGQASEIDNEQKLKNIQFAHLACRSEIKDGEIEIENLSANGGVDLKIIGPKGVAFNGGYVFDRAKWRERPRVLQEDQASADSEYRKCTTYWNGAYRTQDQIDALKKN